MSFLTLDHISVSFDRSKDTPYPLQVLDDISLSIEAGSLVTVFGPNGSGKTTLLNLMAHILRPTKGEVRSEYSEREIGYVFQNHEDTLLPWSTVRENVALPLKLRRQLTKQRIEDRVEVQLSDFDLSEHSEKYIYELSGGLKQLVAIARATVYSPRIVLLDEPFSALDYSISRKMWQRFRNFWSTADVTTVFVSHSVEEAVFLGDLVYVLSARPATIVDRVPVRLPSHRDLGLLTSDAFISARNRVLAAFEKANHT